MQLSGKESWYGQARCSVKQMSTPMFLYPDSGASLPHQPLFCVHQNEVVNRRDLFEEIWGHIEIKVFKKGDLIVGFSFSVKFSRSYSVLQCLALRPLPQRMMIT